MEEERDFHLAVLNKGGQASQSGSRSSHKNEQLGTFAKALLLFLFEVLFVLFGSMLLQLYSVFLLTFFLCAPFGNILLVLLRLGKGLGLRN